MRKKDDLSDFKAAIEISTQMRLEKNSKMVNNATTKGIKLLKRMEDLELVSSASDKELQDNNSQSENEIFSKDTSEDKELLPPYNEEPDKGEIIPSN